MTTQDPKPQQEATKTVSFSFSEQDFSYIKSATDWQLTLKLSDIASQDYSRLRLLDLKHPSFLKQSLTLDQDSLTFTYELEEAGLSLGQIKQGLVSDKLRLALNVLDLATCLSLPVTLLLHPSNLLITKDLRLKMAYRALPEIMVPKAQDEADFIKQAKCLIVSLFTDHSFSQLYTGALEVVELAPFLEELRQLDSLPAMKAQLESLYKDKLTQEKETLTLVKTSRYKLHRYASIWLGVLSLLLLVPLTYLLFVRIPFKERLLEADTAYLKVDYTGVINTLKPIKTSKLPYSQKYELAYAYVKSLNFAKDKEAVILNNVTLKTEELYLDYWIEIGRGNNEVSLDLAKRLNDSDLILYALAQEMAQVRADKSLSGTAREEKLSDLQSNYDKYWKERQDALTDEEGKTTAKAEEAGEQEGPANSDSPESQPAS